VALSDGEKILIDLRAVQDNELDEIIAGIAEGCRA